MPIQIRDLIEDYYNQHHPLARGIELAELMPLAKAFQSRVAQTNLDFSSDSVNRLQSTATRYAQQTDGGKQRFADEDHLRITREMAAYLGSVMLQALDGKWENRGCLLDIAVVKEGKIEFVEDGVRGLYHRWGIWVGRVAVKAWEVALSGKADMLEFIMWRDK